jgi:AraC-like DNA-binding protein/ligand-binding sensor protein
MQACAENYPLIEANGFAARGLSPAAQRGSSGAVIPEQYMAITMLEPSPATRAGAGRDKRIVGRLAGILQRLSRSEMFKDYEQAFSETTKLPLALRPLETWNLSMAGKPRENPFCELLAKCNRTCAACLEVQEKIANQNATGPTTVTCFAGLCETAVPVRVGERVIGHLQTGQVSLNKPNAVQFEKITKQLIEWGVNLDLRKLKDAYFHSRVLSSGEYKAMIKLLEIFAKHLSLVANQIVLQEDEAEPPLVRRARAYIVGHQADPIDLDNVAKAMHVSTFYFCKMFKKATGLTFTEYLGRVRTEKAKTLLLNPHLRITEIAYNVGFRSLTHFNRVFRQIAGQSPTAFRASKSGDRSLRRNGANS